MTPLKPRRVVLVRHSTFVQLVVLLPLVAWITFIFVVILQLKAPTLSLTNEISTEGNKPETEPETEPTRYHLDHEDNARGGGVLVLPDDLKPGELGKPFVLPKNLTQEQKKLVSDGWTKNAFNQFASDQISVRRSLPDVRNDWCKPRQPPASLLPVTSIIMCFHNEARSVLLRSVHSVLDRSPPELIREIILVDDFSDMEHLKAPLEIYFSSYPTVRIIRAPKRIGLIKARLMGAAVAQGPVLTFLDSHIEATTGWLEPLLERVALNPTTVSCPVIDIIDDETLEYHPLKADSVGGFTWSLVFNWHSIPRRERSRRKNPSEPVHSPTMAGGLFSIDKEFFERLGSYDPDFDIWGGENLELSFKIWMCGGTLEIVPCSRVGHIFRKRSPYKWRTGVNVVRRNLVRLAKVWMDDYAEYYFQTIGNDLGEYGDVSDRIRLRESLQCKDFKWYLENVYPEQFIPGEALGQGEIRNEGFGNETCLDSAASSRDVNKPVGLYQCHGMGGNQVWFYSKNREIRRDDMCLHFGGSGQEHNEDVIIYPCVESPIQHWDFNVYAGQLRHLLSQKCLALKRGGSKLMISMEKCDQTKASQRWRFGQFRGGSRTME